MTYVKRFFGFWYEFVIGDDWSIAAGVALALGLTRVLVQLGLNPWWLMPLAVTAALAISLRREVSKVESRS
jgi:hypothetical protein